MFKNNRINIENYRRSGGKVILEEEENRFLVSQNIVFLLIKNKKIKKK